MEFEVELGFGFIVEILGAGAFRTKITGGLDIRGYDTVHASCLSSTDSWIWKGFYKTLLVAL